MKDTAYTYIVECGDGTFYTGWTNQLEQRIRCHNEGKGAKYTRARRPVQLVYYETFPTKQEAMRREYAIKQLLRKDKEKLIHQMTDKDRDACMRINECIVQEEKTET